MITDYSEDFNKALAKFKTHKQPDDAMAELVRELDSSRNTCWDTELRRCKLSDMAEQLARVFERTMSDDLSRHRYFSVLAREEVVIIEIFETKAWSVIILERKICFIFRIMFNWYLLLDIPNAPFFLCWHREEWRNRKGFEWFSAAFGTLDPKDERIVAWRKRVHSSA